MTLRRLGNSRIGLRKRHYDFVMMLHDAAFCPSADGGAVRAGGEPGGRATSATTPRAAYPTFRAPASPAQKSRPLSSAGPQHTPVQVSERCWLVMK